MANILSELRRLLFIWRLQHIVHRIWYIVLSATLGFQSVRLLKMLLNEDFDSTWSKFWFKEIKTLYLITTRKVWRLGFPKRKSRLLADSLSTWAGWGELWTALDSAQWPEPPSEVQSSLQLDGPFHQETGGSVTRQFAKNENLLF